MVGAHHLGAGLNPTQTATKGPPTWNTHTHRHDEKSAFLHQFLPSWTGSCLGQLPEELRRESNSTVFLAPGLAGQGPRRPELASVFQRLHVEECSPPLPCKPGLDWAPKVPMEKRG